MKEKALQMVGELETEHLRLNYLRDYLQQVILREVFEFNWLSDLVFHGGTALRIIHGLNRFSEDLDFHLKKPKSDYPVSTKLNKLRKRLELNGYDVEIKYPSGSNVKKISVKFAGGLLYQAEVSPHEGQKLNIKLEIDTNPPSGFGVDRSLINQYFPLVLTHHDKESFIAGKCHAILQRDWAKGRDFFDLLYYLTRWEGINPNFVYLNSVLEQTGYEGEEVNSDNWKDRIMDRVEEVRWSIVEEDVKPFLLNRGDLKAFKKEFLIAELSE